MASSFNLGISTRDSFSRDQGMPCQVVGVAKVPAGIWKATMRSPSISNSYISSKAIPSLVNFATSRLRRRSPTLGMLASLRYTVPLIFRSFVMPKRSHPHSVPRRFASLLSAEKYFPISSKS